MLIVTYQDVDVPGGQTVYVTPTGQLKFTPAGIPSPPEGAVTKSFIREEFFPEIGDIYGAIVFDGDDFVACPCPSGTPGVYQVSVASISFANNCVKFRMASDENSRDDGQRNAYEYN